MRFKKLKPFRVMDLVRQAKRYEDTIHFEIGEPDLPPPPAVKEALKKAVDENRFAYTQSKGLLPLREKIASYYLRMYEVEIDPDLIIITPGTSNAFLIAYLLSLKEEGVLGLADPSYPCYRNFAVMVDAKSHFFPVNRESSYLLRAKDLYGVRLDAVHISSPSNPTGALYDPDSLKELASYCEAEGIRLISDELYHGLTYEQKAHSVLEFSRDAIVINGFSKYFCMPGLRIGWMILPKDLIRPAEIIAQNLFISAPTLSQYAALEAFDYDYLERVRQSFKERRDWLYSKLDPLLPVDARAQGAFYLWCDASAYTNDSEAFAKELLEAIHIAVTPGVDFGENGTQSKLRFAYTKSIEHMSEGIERLKSFLDQKGA